MHKPNRQYFEKLQAGDPCVLVIYRTEVVCQKVTHEQFVTLRFSESARAKKNHEQMKKEAANLAAKKFRKNLNLLPSVEVLVPTVTLLRERQGVVR